MMFRKYTSALLVLFLPQIICSSVCPTNCQCQENVTWVKCQNWLTLPDFPSYIEHIDMSHNHLGPTINKTFFHYGNLVHLDLSFNSLMNMTERGLRGLTKLEYLNLSNNNLRYLPNNMFCDNTNIRVLDISNNFFAVLPDVIFRSLDNLRYFSIRNNKLTKLHLGPRWQVPTKLEEIDLSYNKFDNITENAFEFTSYWDITVKRSLNLKNCGIKFISNGTLSLFKGLNDLNLSENPGFGGENLLHLLLELEGTHLKKLDLSGMHLSEIQPLFIDVEKLALEHLNLANNFLREIPPWAVGNIRSLQYLNLSNNNLATNIVGLKDLSNLKSLDLSFNQLLGFVSEITTQLSRLTFLDLSHNQLQQTTDIDLLPLRNLQVLNVSNNKLNSLILPGNTTELQVLKFAENKITQLFSIHNIPKLVSFDISGNDITSLGSFLFAQSYDFQLANFSNNKIAFIDHRSFLPTAPNIIDLSHNALAEVKFSSWSDASEIYLHHNQIAEVSYQAFYAMSGLQVLDLSHNKLIDIPEITFKYLVELQRLNLGNNGLNIKPHDFVDVFISLKSLRSLDLSNNDLSEMNITTFVNCPHIEKLFLAYNKFTNIPIMLFDHLENLTYFDASGNPLICDCDLLPFRDWISENLMTKMSRSYDQTKYKCVNPPGRIGVAILDFTAVRFECNESLLYMIIFGSIGGLLIVVGIVGSLVCHYYRKWRKKNPRPITKKKMKKLSNVDRIRKSSKEKMAKEFEKESKMMIHTQNGGTAIPYIIRERETVEPCKRLPQYRANKFNLPQVLPGSPADNWQKLRIRNDPRRFHTVNPRMPTRDEQTERWNACQQQRQFNTYSTMPFPNSVSQYEVNRNRPEREVTFDINSTRHRQSVDDCYLDMNRHRYRHPRDLHRNRNRSNYGERKFSMPNVYMYDKTSDWV